MLADDVTPTKARILALQAGIALLVLILLSNGTFNFFGFTIGFLFVPLIVIYFWPRAADPSLTYLILFLCGLFFDLLSGNTPGVWALIFMIGWTIARPYLFNKEVSLGQFWFGFAVWVGIFSLVFCGFDFLGSGSTSVRNIVLQATIAILVFPVLYAVRLLLKNIFSGTVD